MSRALFCETKNKWFDNGATSDCARARSRGKVSEVPCSRMSRTRLSACQNDSVARVSRDSECSCSMVSCSVELRPILVAPSKQSARKRKKTKFLEDPTQLSKSANLAEGLPQPCGRECLRRGVHMPLRTLRCAGSETPSNAATPVRRSLGVPLSRQELW